MSSHAMKQLTNHGLRITQLSMFSTVFLTELFPLSFARCVNLLVCPFHYQQKGANIIIKPEVYQTAMKIDSHCV